MKNRTITVFEHDKLIVGHDGLESTHFNALVKFNDRHKGKYFTVGFNKISFKSYVGVLQVGSTVIEILPKADENTTENEKQKAKWQRALLTMLRRSGYIKMNETEIASLDLTRQNLLDIYISLFLKEVEHLVRSGLVKKYRREAANLYALKGRLIVNKHIQHNLIHKERFYTERSIYDCDNKYNQILKSALLIVKNNVSKHSIAQRVAQNLSHFELVSNYQDQEFDQLHFDRKTAIYKESIILAKMIIQNYCPDFSAGNHQVLALLFDMNRLYETYIFNTLKRFEHPFANYNLSVKKQISRGFWEDRTVKPDILINYEIDGIKGHVVIDTKWKVIDEDTPSHDDLKQMFVYNLQFGAYKSILFYPKVNQSNSGIKNYVSSELTKELVHGCELYFAKLFDDYDILSDEFARNFLLEQFKGSENEIGRSK